MLAGRTCGNVLGSRNLEFQALAIQTHLCSSGLHSLVFSWPGDQQLQAPLMFNTAFLWTTAQMLGLMIIEITSPMCQCQSPGPRRLPVVGTLVTDYRRGSQVCDTAWSTFCASEACCSSIFTFVLTFNFLHFFYQLYGGKKHEDSSHDYIPAPSEQVQIHQPLYALSSLPWAPTSTGRQSASFTWIDFHSLATQGDACPCVHVLELVSLSLLCSISLWGHCSSLIHSPLICIQVTCSLGLL